MLDGCEAAKTRLARRYRLLCTETSVLAMVHNAEVPSLRLCKEIHA